MKLSGIGTPGPTDVPTTASFPSLYARQEEVQHLQCQCSRQQEVCRGSVAALREALISLEERTEAGRKEVCVQSATSIYTHTFYMHTCRLTDTR